MPGPEDATCRLLSASVSRSSSVQVVIGRGEQRIALSGWHFQRSKPLLVGMGRQPSTVLTREAASRLLACAKHAAASSTHGGPLETSPFWLGLIEQIAQGAPNPRAPRKAPTNLDARCLEDPLAAGCT